MSKIADLNAHLFAQLDRLGASDISEERLEQEIKRSQAIATISNELVKGYDVKLRAAKLLSDNGALSSNLLPMLDDKTDPMSGKTIKFEDK